MVKGLEQAGYRVLLLDNRDVGGSTRFDEWGQPTLWWQLLKNQLGFDVDAPYTLNDMAADTIALMDLLELEDAHVVGASMGGMIAQVIAARYPQRTRTLVSIMSSTGAPHLPPPTAEASDRVLVFERSWDWVERILFSVGKGLPGSEIAGENHSVADSESLGVLADGYDFSNAL